jgi:trans-aconitate 2-methyltransferase
MKGIVSALALAPFLLFSAGVEDAITYHANSELQWRVAMDTIELSPWTESDQILDIGCGDGRVTALLAKRTPDGSVLGIDISQSMIEFASSHYPKAEYPNLAFRRQDAAEISFENQFDRVVSFSTLHWVLDQERALKAIHRALVPGGTICIHTYGKGPMNVTDIGDQLVRTEKWASHFPSYFKQRVFFTLQEYQTLLEKVGFEQIQIIGSRNYVTFADRQALINFAKPLLNFIRHLAPDLQKEFVEEVADRIIAVAGPSDDGRIQYQTASLQVVASKWIDCQMTKGAATTSLTLLTKPSE